MKPQALQLGLSPRQHTTLLALGLLALVVTLMLVSHPTLAGTGGAEFNPLYTKLSDWMTGYLGRVVAAVFIIDPSPVSWFACGRTLPGAGL